MEHRDESENDISLLMLLKLNHDVLGEIFNFFSMVDALKFERTSKECAALLNTAPVDNSKGFWSSRKFQDRLAFIHYAKARFFNTTAHSILSNFRYTYLIRCDRERNTNYINMYCFGDPKFVHPTDYHDPLETDMRLVGNRLEISTRCITMWTHDPLTKLFENLQWQRNDPLFILFANDQQEFDNHKNLIKAALPKSLIHQSLFFAACPIGVKINCDGLLVNGVVEFKKDKLEFSDFSTRIVALLENAAKDYQVEKSLNFRS